MVVCGRYREGRNMGYRKVKERLFLVGEIQVFI